MKQIRKFTGPMPDLDDYRRRAGEKASWQGYCNNKKRRQTLANTLTDLQHGLCGYCEIDLRDDNFQVEHVVPQSHPQEGKRRALDATNLIACCLGGTRSDAGDSAHYLAPPNANMSCGQRKGNDTIPVDPRTLPALPSLTRVGPDGRIEVDEDACQAEEWATDGVGETIELLGLNAERLRLAREELWRALEEAWEDLQGDEDIMREAAREELLPDDDTDRLPQFFTTRRSYFSAWGGEAILEEEPRRWI